MPGTSTAENSRHTNRPRAHATYGGHVTAFTVYEERIRAFVEQNQALVGDGRNTLAPETQEMIDARNAALRSAAPASARGYEAHTALELPEY